MRARPAEKSQLVRQYGRRKVLFYQKGKSRSTPLGPKDLGSDWKSPRRAHDRFETHRPRPLHPHPSTQTSTLSPTEQTRYSKWNSKIYTPTTATTAAAAAAPVSYARRLEREPENRAEGRGKNPPLFCFPLQREGERVMQS